MGKLARELAQPDPSLLDDLVRAYADEWFAHYNYFFVSHMVGGPSSASISQLVRQKSDAALRRAERLAQRVIELGGQPVPKLTQLIEHATDKPFKLPEDLGDIDGLLRAVLDAERTSMRMHHDLHQRSRERDPVTASLMLQLLGECTQGEQQLERLLGEEAPELDGT
jgi:bacterioferritin